MCKTHNPRKIDDCMESFILNLEYYLRKRLKILACCCGHGRYPMTIIVQNIKSEIIFDLISDKEIKRKKKFYKKDKKGYYYIPEVCEAKS